MKIKIIRQDGSVVEAEGDAEEIAKLAGAVLAPPAPIPYDGPPVSPYVPVPYVTPWWLNPCGVCGKYGCAETHITWTVSSATIDTAAFERIASSSAFRDALSSAVRPC